jgi:tight adherence protein B
VGSLIAVPVLGRASRARARARDLAPPRGRSASGRRPFAAAIAATRRVVLGDEATRAREAALPTALEATARGLRAGGSLRQSIAEAALVVPEPLRSELASVAVDADRGGSLVEALERWGRGRQQAGARLAVAALSLVADTGGSPARTLDAVAATLRERAAIEREVRALSTQARASALVVAVAPLAFTVLMALVDPATVGFLLGSPAGLGCLVIGVVLDVAGGLWMRRITGAVR